MKRTALTYGLISGVTAAVSAFIIFFGVRSYPQNYIGAN
jgi:hypothetical protein